MQSLRPRQRFNDYVIWLDSCANVGVFRNRNRLDDIRPGPPNSVSGFISKVSISHIETNAIFGKHYFEARSDKNILPPWLMAQRFNCRENGDATAFIFQIPGETQRRTFSKCNGLFRRYIGDIYGIPEVNDYNNINVTVAENEKNFSVREVKQAKIVKAFISNMGYPSSASVLALTKSNMMNNLDFTAGDVRRATTIYGSDIATLKGKSTNRPAPMFNTQILEERLTNQVKNKNLGNC